MEASQQQPTTDTTPLQTPPLAPTSDTLKFFLANVGFTQTATQIKSYIEQYFGPVNYVKLIPYRDPNAASTGGGTATKHKGFGFLYMMTDEGSTALENYVNAFPGNKIRLVEREGVYVAKHDEQRAKQGNSDAVGGGADGAVVNYGYTAGYVVDANGYAVTQPIQYAATSVPTQPTVAYSANQQPQQQGVYSAAPSQQTQPYVYATPAVTTSVPVGDGNTQQQPPGYAPQPQQGGYQQPVTYQQPPQQVPQPTYEQPIYSQQPQYNQQQQLQPPQMYLQQAGTAQQQYHSQQLPQPINQTGPPQPINQLPQQQLQPMYQQQQPYGPPMDQYSNQQYDQGGRFGGGRFSRGGRGRNHPRGGRMGGRGPPPPPPSRGPIPMGMRDMPPPPPPRGGRGRGGGSFRGGRSVGGRHQRDNRRDRPY